MEKDEACKSIWQDGLPEYKAKSFKDWEKLYDVKILGEALPQYYRIAAPESRQKMYRRIYFLKIAI